MENPSEFAMTCRPRQDLALRYPKGSAPAPVARTAQPGKSAGKSELKTEKLGGNVKGRAATRDAPLPQGIGGYVGKRLFIGEAYDRTIHQIPHRLHGPARRTHQQT
ncbi:hypothetical protein ACVWWG_000251 [Bradyrhizobium sp. LB7.2]|jgi:hypothetical protein